MEEIINKGYDGEDFSKYMDKLKENGIILIYLYIRWLRFRYMVIR